MCFQSYFMLNAHDNMQETAAHVFHAVKRPLEKPTQVNDDVCFIVWYKFLLENLMPFNCSIKKSYSMRSRNARVEEQKKEASSENVSERNSINTN